MSTIKNRLEEIRKAKGISQVDLSEKAKVSRMTIMKIETEPDANITTDTMARIADALDTPILDIFLF